jgi:site-specific DNA recombinase
LWVPLYRQRVDRLHEELNRAELRSEAAQARRGLIDEVRLIPENGRLEIELLGDLAGILALSASNKKPVTENRDGLQVTLVAGARNQRCLHALRARIPVLPRPLTAATPVRIR